jgi:hypothetical protein
MIGFYVFAIGIALGLLYLPYAEVVYAHRLHFKLALFCLIGAAVILWSISCPVRTDSRAFGPAMWPQHQPNLVLVIREVGIANRRRQQAST